MKRQPTLTDAQRRILTAAARKGGTPADQHHTLTVELLEACALVTLHDHDNVGDWTILTTRAGREVLHRPVADRPVYLRQRDGLTHRRHEAVRDEDEVVDAATLENHWEQEAAKRHAGQRERREAARRVSRGMRAA